MLLMTACISAKRDYQDECSVVISKQGGNSNGIQLGVVVVFFGLLVHGSAGNSVSSIIEFPFATQKRRMK